VSRGPAAPAKYSCQHGKLNATRRYGRGMPSPSRLVKDRKISPPVDSPANRRPSFGHRRNTGRSRHTSQTENETHRQGQREGKARSHSRSVRQRPCRFRDHKNRLLAAMFDVRRGDRPAVMIEHHGEIAHIKPAFKELKLNRGRPMASASQGRP
jgi:hypothetical protein